MPCHAHLCVNEGKDAPAVWRYGATQLLYRHSFERPNRYDIPSADLTNGFWRTKVSSLIPNYRYVEVGQ
jgi:hypothetical protein